MSTEEDKKLLWKELLRDETDEAAEMWFQLSKKHLTTNQKLDLIREINIDSYDKEFADFLKKFNALLKLTNK